MGYGRAGDTQSGTCSTNCWPTHWTDGQLDGHKKGRYLARDLDPVLMSYCIVVAEVYCTYRYHTCTVQYSRPAGLSSPVEETPYTQG